MCLEHSSEFIDGLQSEEYKLADKLYFLTFQRFSHSLNTVITVDQSSNAKQAIDEVGASGIIAG